MCVSVKCSQDVVDNPDDSPLTIRFQFWGGYKGMIGEVYELLLVGNFVEIAQEREKNFAYPAAGSRSFGVWVVVSVGGMVVVC